MSKPGSLSSLAGQLQRQIEEDRKQIERHRKRTESILSAELKTLSENLRRRVLEEASSTERAMESLNRSATAILKRLALLGVFLGLSVSLGTLTVNWALGQWQSSRIENLKEERARLEAEIEGQRLTLKRLDEKTWGIQLVKDDQGPLVVLPQGALPNPEWTWGGRPAVPLPRK